MAFGMILIFLFSIACVQCQAKWIPCPFNEHECICEPVEVYSHITMPSPVNRQLKFYEVKCFSNNSAMPKFTAPENVTYEYVGGFTITGNVSDIPSNHFSMFKAIVELRLIQIDGCNPVNQIWNESAFDGIQVHWFHVKNLAGVIPPPLALRRLAKQDLYLLKISQCPTPISLDDHIFEDFSHLGWLFIENCPISHISEFAFAGLEKKLIRLQLTNTSLTEFPFIPLKNLSRLSQLELPNNKFTHIPELGNWTAFNCTPWNCTGMSSFILNLTDNPISIIEKDAFSAFRSRVQVHLENTKLRSIDLSVFAGLGGIPSSIVDLSHNPFLTHLTISDTTKISALQTHQPKCDNSYIYIMNTNLTTIDPKIGEILHNKDTHLKLDISYNKRLQCKDLAWMANVSCHFNVGCSRCADKNHQFLRDFLKSVPHDSACFVQGKDSNCPLPPGNNGKDNNGASTASTAI